LFGWERLLVSSSFFKFHIASFWFVNNEKLETGNSQPETLARVRFTDPGSDVRMKLADCFLNLLNAPRIPIREAEA
jgi:hypothetical protein